MPFKNPEDKAAYDRSRAKMKATKEGKEKRSAYNAVSDALRSGRLSRGVCEVCNSRIVDSHHDNYQMKLEVRWLCRKHHTLLHQAKRKEN